MQEEQVARWAAAFEAGMASEENVDLEPLWNDVSAAITANPDHQGLRRLRIRMAEAFFERATHHEDLLALHRIDPANRQDCLELAVLQHRWASMLSPDDEEEAQATLESQARDWLAQLLRAQREDADFCVEVFVRWSQAYIYAPWLRLTLALEVCAAHPAHDRLARELAFAWQDLANQVPEDFDSEKGSIPMGFMIDVGGALWDPFLQERALVALARLLETHPDDTDLLSRRAQLLEARCDFPAAAEAYALAHHAAVRVAPLAQSDEAREELASLASNMAERASLCRSGRAAIATAMADGLAAAVAQLGQPVPRREGASPQAQAFAEDWARESREHAKELEASLEQLREAVPMEVDEAQLDAIGEVANQVAASILGGIQLAPLTIVPITPAAFEQDWASELQGVRQAFEQLGWRNLGWAEWPDFRAMLGRQAVSSNWLGSDGATAALVFSVGGSVMLDLETGLGDGRMVISSLSRGKNFMSHGPDLDTLHIEPSVPIAEACALHLARVSHVLAHSPGLTLRPCPDLAAFAALQERGRELKTRFRLEHGLTESESLGVPHDFPELLSPLLREAVAEGVAALRHATRP